MFVTLGGAANKIVSASTPISCAGSSIIRSSPLTYIYIYYFFYIHECAPVHINGRGEVDRSVVKQSMLNWRSVSPHLSWRGSSFLKQEHPPSSSSSSLSAASLHFPTSSFLTTPAALALCFASLPFSTSPYFTPLHHIAAFLYCTLLRLATFFFFTLLRLVTFLYCTLHHST